ncbi:type VI secretion system tube protein Hcp [Paraburkholderia flagellata]|uniref:type VI secretion system tube protein Hcp n=1 Tax=Paraburkholderia flagellata TaxID=2883241 RepID=UPI001F28A37A|nr:type VI secretion system tube protein Hcp [Paraburkholderia flagellata]
MPGTDAPPQAASRLTLDYVRQFDAFALPDAEDMFLYVIPKRSNTAVKGEAPARGDWETPMRIHGWRWAEGYETLHAGHALNANDMRVTDVGVVKSVDSTSPVIAKLCAQSELLALAQIKCFKSGGPDNGVQIEFLSMKLEEAYIRNYSIYTSVRLGRMCEVFELTAQKMTLTCAAQKPDGSRAAEVNFALDVLSRRII